MILGGVERRFEDFSAAPVSSGLRMRSPRQFIALRSAIQAPCPA